MDKDLIVIWSGIIWRTLNERGKLSVQELKQATGLEFEAIYAAVGWLAREATKAVEAMKASGTIESISDNLPLKES